MTEDVIVRRLTLVKHVYKLGIEQASLPDTISFSAILLLHDALDMFMDLAAEKKGIGKGLYLMQYFDSIPELRMKTSVEKINKRRNGLKHNGIVPGKIEIQDTCSVSKYFLEENTKIIFEKDFNDISLFDLIGYDKVREFLKAGNNLFEKNKLESAATEIAKAYFHLLLIDDSLNKNKIKNPWYDSTDMFVMKDYKFYAKAFEPMFVGQENALKELKTEDGYVEISEGVATLASYYNKAFSFIFQSLNILYLGLDYKKYNHYSSFMPVIFSYNKDDEKYTIGMPLGHPQNIIRENIAFAIEFVLEFALKIQEFKY